MKESGIIFFMYICRHCEGALVLPEQSLTSGDCSPACNTHGAFVGKSILLAMTGIVFY